MLETLLHLAQRFDAQYGGMASIHIQYQPYDAHWEAQASWSGGETVTTVGMTAEQAMRALEKKLSHLDFLM